MGLFHSLILLYFCTKHSIYKIITYIFEKLYFYLKDEKTCRCFKVFRFQQKIWISFHKILRVYIRNVLFISKRPPPLDGNKNILWSNVYWKTDGQLNGIWRSLGKIERATIPKANLMVHSKGRPLVARKEIASSYLYIFYITYY